MQLITGGQAQGSESKVLTVSRHDKHAAEQRMRYPAPSDAGNPPWYLNSLAVCHTL
jgi:hypothetical protein